MQSFYDWCTFAVGELVDKTETIISMQFSLQIGIIIRTGGYKQLLLFITNKMSTQEVLFIKSCVINNSIQIEQSTPPTFS